MTAKRDVWFALTFMPQATAEIARSSGVTLEAAYGYLKELLCEGYVVRKGAAIQPTWYLAARSTAMHLESLDDLDRRTFNTGESVPF